MKPVIAFDGEGIDDRYTLLASNCGYLENEAGLDLDQCLDFLTRPEYHQTLNFWFSFGYDVNMMGKAIKDIDFWRGNRGVIWRGYEIRYFPHKILKIRKGNKRFTHYDIFGFFQCSFRTAIEKWLGVNDPLINKGKAARGNFADWLPADIREYNARELKYLAELGEKLVSIFSTLDIELKMKSWHGAGAGANAALKLIKLDEELESDPRLEEYAQAAYYGGRIELCQRGQFKNLWHGDLRSAYPTAMLSLPNLSESIVKHTRQFKVDRLGVYHVTFKTDPASPFGPFPVRKTSGAICFPLEGEGVYWSLEVSAAFDAGVNVQIKDGLVFEHSTPSRLAELVQSLYNLRAEYRANHDGREKAVKLILNSLYGKLAQKVGGRYHSLALAGLITSITRATLYKTAMQNPRAIIGFATDGLFSRQPLKVCEGAGLGEWESEQLSSATFLMNGMYLLDKQGELTRKSRGFDADQWAFEKIAYDLQTRGQADVTERRFVTNLIALHSPKAYPRPCEWREMQKTIRLDTDNKRHWPKRYTGSIQLSRPQCWDTPSKPYTPLIREELGDLLLPDDLV